MRDRARDTRVPGWRTRVLDPIETGASGNGSRDVEPTWFQTGRGVSVGGRSSSGSARASCSFSAPPSEDTSELPCFSTSPSFSLDFTSFFLFSRSRLLSPLLFHPAEDLPLLFLLLVFFPFSPLFCLLSLFFLPTPQNPSFYSVLFIYLFLYLPSPL